MVRCQWGLNYPFRCTENSDCVTAGICEDGHIESYSYCDRHYKAWMSWTTADKGWKWICRQCGKPIIENMTENYP